MTRTPAVPMSRNYYSEINLHLTWHTKDSEKPRERGWVEEMVVDDWSHKCGG